MWSHQYRQYVHLRCPHTLSDGITLLLSASVKFPESRLKRKYQPSATCLGMLPKQICSGLPAKGPLSLSDTALQLQWLPYPPAAVWSPAGQDSTVPPFLSQPPLQMQQPPLTKEAVVVAAPGSPRLSPLNSKGENTKNIHRFQGQTLSGPDHVARRTGGKNGQFPLALVTALALCAPNTCSSREISE